MKPEDLAATGWERVYGTNMQHAFNLAGRLLAQHPRATKQVIMVTDGEPTAHLEGEEVVLLLAAGPGDDPTRPCRRRCAWRRPA